MLSIINDIMKDGRLFSMDTTLSWNTRDRQVAQDRPSLRYESLNELRYVSRLTKAAITCARVRVRGEHSYPWPLAMTRHRVAIFSRHRFSRRDLRAAYFHSSRPTSE